MKDDNIEIEIQSTRFKDAFTQLVFNVYSKFISESRIEYEPEEVRNSKEIWVGKKEERGVQLEVF